MKMVVSDRAEGIRSLWKVSFIGGVPRTKDSDYMYVYINIDTQILMSIDTCIFLKKRRKGI